MSSGDRKAVVKNADMDDEMQQTAVEFAAVAIEKFQIEKDIASYLKKEFDKKYGPTWHCVVGRHFGSSLDEGFERAQTLNEPVTSFKLSRLRPETIYFVCLRVLRRKRANPEAATKPALDAPQKPGPTGTQTKSIGTATATKRPTLTTVLPWQQRHALNVKAPENYAFELRCTEAATQNWHLSALIGGLLGVGLALILGIILLIIVKRKHWSTTSKYGAEKSLLHSEGNGGLHRKTRYSWRNGNGWRSNLSARSYSTRGISDFSGNLREEDEDDEEDAIAEDDEDTEADTGCKSSVRSQTGIYGGSGGTTSSNRHSSVSSIDPREDTSSVTHHLQKGVAQIASSKRDSRKTVRQQDVRAPKRVSKAAVPSERSPVAQRKPPLPQSNSLEQQRVQSVNDTTKEYPGVTVNILSPSPERIETKEDLRSLEPKTPGDGQTASDSSEQSLVTPNSLNVRLHKDSADGYSVCEVNVCESVTTQNASRRKTIAAVFQETGLCPGGVERGHTQRHSVVENHIVRNPLFSPPVRRTPNEILEPAACLSPAPRFDPQMVNLEPPLLLSPPPHQPAECFFEETWIRSPHLENSPLSQPVVVDNVSWLSSGVYSPVNSSVNSPPSTKSSSSSLDLDLQSAEYCTDQNIYAEFIETI